MMLTKPFDFKKILEYSLPVVAVIVSCLTAIGLSILPAYGGSERQSGDTVDSAATAPEKRFLPANVDADSLPAHFPKTKAEYSDLGLLMEKGIHEHFTFLSFTVWHNQPLDDEKYYSIGASARHLTHYAAQISDFKKSGWDSERKSLFDLKARQFSRLSETMIEAAQKKDKVDVKQLVVHIENSCTSCHSEFNKKLAHPTLNDENPK